MGPRTLSPPNLALAAGNLPLFFPWLLSQVALPLGSPWASSWSAFCFRPQVPPAWFWAGEIFYGPGSPLGPSQEVMFGGAFGGLLLPVAIPSFRFYLMCYLPLYIA